MNYSELITSLAIDPSCLEDKKEQTTKKLEYVSAYVREWLHVAIGAKAKHIVFIDAMSNAGIYKDGQLGTAALVSKAFSQLAVDYPSVDYRIYINDASKSRAEACERICRKISAGNHGNIAIEADSMDVNDYLKKLVTSKKIPQGKGAFVLLFVDPYNAGTVHLNAVRYFIRHVYADVLFNWFSSDYVRNRKDPRIFSCFDGLSISEGADSGELVAEALRCGHIQYVFRYSFHTSTNTELYQIIFLTPHVRGLEKNKDALWGVFGGRNYHRNSRQPSQLSMFPDAELSKSNAEHHSAEAQQLLLEKFAGLACVPYSSISLFLLETSMLKEGQILSGALKPLIREGLVRKLDMVSPRDYKKDSYSFENVGESHEVR